MRIPINIPLFPTGLETITFPACLTSIWMNRLSHSEHSVQRVHEAFYQRLCLVSGAGALLPDRSIPICSYDAFLDAALGGEMVRRSMREAGFAYTEYGQGSDCYAQIRASLDAGVPALLQDKESGRWKAITGYDDQSGALIGLDGSQGYWGKQGGTPDRYLREGLFLNTRWKEQARRILVITGEAAWPPLPPAEHFLYFADTLLRTRTDGVYENLLGFLRDEKSFANMTQEELSAERDWLEFCIGFPIDQRAMTGAALSNAFLQEAKTERQSAALQSLSQRLIASCDALWVGWRSIGALEEGDPSRRLLEENTRTTIAQGIRTLEENDAKAIQSLRHLAILLEEE